jgi:hypothetical protein
MSSPSHVYILSLFQWKQWKQRKDAICSTASNGSVASVTGLFANTASLFLECLLDLMVTTPHGVTIQTL